MDARYLLYGITYAFACAVQPGPLQSYLISQTLKNGWRSTLPAALAPVLSDGPIVLLVLFLLRTIPTELIIGLRIGGGAFLLFLGMQAFIAWKKVEPLNVSADAKKQTLSRAVLVNLINPSPYLSWSLVMGPWLLQGWQSAPVNGIALIAGFYSTMIIMLAGIVMLFSFAGKLGAKVSKALLLISAIILLLFGIYQLSIGIADLVHGIPLHEMG